MPSVFLSYSREDLPLIEQLEAHLKASSSDISIWRDQEQIYGGQKWPKVLGEAIADQDVFLLAWSKNAATSHFVEIEQAAAVALKKTIVPCLLDNTPLPVSLQATHAIPITDLPRLVSALTSAGTVEDAGRRTEVIRKLDQITATSSQDVSKSVTTLFNQHTLTVHGPVIHGKNVTVHIGRESVGSPKSLVERWEMWIGIVAGVITIMVGLVVDLPETFKPTAQTTESTSTTKPIAHEKPTPQLLIGAIRNEANDPLPDVQVALPQFNLTNTTDSLGQFRFEVTALAQETVALLAQKPGYQTYEADVTLGNPALGFTMRKRP